MTPAEKRAKIEEITNLLYEYRFTYPKTYIRQFARAAVLLGHLDLIDEYLEDKEQIIDWFDTWFFGFGIEEYRPRREL